MKPPVDGWERIISREPVHIPTVSGEKVSETLWVDIPAWQDPKTGNIYLDGEGRGKLEAVKARYLGLLTPQQLRALRETIGATQQGMAGLLQLGQKSWTRWESGRERPSRSMNVLLCALYDGRIDVNYLRELSDPARRSQFNRWAPNVRFDVSEYSGCERYIESKSYECTPIAA